MAAHIIADAIKCILGIGIALLVYGLLRGSLSTLLSQLVVLPEATTFYLRSFAIVLLFAGIGAGITDVNVKPDARLMEYFLEVSTESSGVFQQVLLTLLAYLVLITLMVVVLSPRMRNEEFLITAYIVVATSSLFLGAAASISLRDPVGKIANRIPHGGWGKIVKRSYPAGILLSALAGFLSVSYFGCQNKSYEEVISKAHVITISGEQISESLYSIVAAIFLGAIVILMSLLVIRRSAPKP